MWELYQEDATSELEAADHDVPDTLMEMDEAVELDKSLPIAKGARQPPTTKAEQETSVRAIGLQLEKFPPGFQAKSRQTKSRRLRDNKKTPLKPRTTDLETAGGGPEDGMRKGKEDSGVQRRTIKRKKGVSRGTTVAPSVQLMQKTPKKSAGSIKREQQLKTNEAAILRVQESLRSFCHQDSLREIVGLAIENLNEGEESAELIDGLRAVENECLDGITGSIGKLVPLLERSGILQIGAFEGVVGKINDVWMDGEG